MRKGGRECEVDRERTIKGGANVKGQSVIVEKAYRTELRNREFANITISLLETALWCTICNTFLQHLLNPRSKRNFNIPKLEYCVRIPCHERKCFMQCCHSVKTV